MSQEEGEGLSGWGSQSCHTGLECRASSLLLGPRKRSDDRPEYLILSSATWLPLIPRLMNGAGFPVKRGSVTALFGGYATKMFVATVVLKLRSSCITMSEEEVAKMSVKLLNCQSATEGRQQFPCTDDMTLKECTSPMDAIMWNTYHLMNNRALAVCHSVKNMQFRALNEMTVNKLMTAAHDQLASMESLKESQVKVQMMTSNTLESVAKNNTVLMSQQDKLFSMQHNIKDFVALNLRELTREKALIAAGHQEIAKLTADIKKSVELTSVSAATQRVEWQENHKELLLQIDKIKDNINAVLDGIELRTQLITSHNDMVITHHKVLMENLAKINGTVNFLLNIVDRSRDEFNARLGWIASRVTGTADSLDQVYIFALHGAYLIVGMIISSFVNVPNFTRMFLLLIVILNVILSLQKGPYSPMDFFTMTVLMFASIAVQLFVQTAQAYFGPKNLAALTYSNKSNSPKNGENFVPPANPTQSLSVSNFFKEHGVEISKPRARLSATRYTEFVRERNSVYHPPTPPTSTRTSSHSGTPPRSGTPRPTCIAYCRSGLRCRISSLPTSEFCRIHSGSPYLS
uniref:Protein brambleberry n=1 Tax=Timema monikensis TaxID=170555 RepID=A0A7R9HSH5_9NEOP|nr:unnamed protein product [Timema monikensis]